MQNWYKYLPPHLINVSTLSCETWNARWICATIELLQEETPDFIPPQLWPPNLPDLNSVDFSMWKYCNRRCTKYSPLIWTNWNSDWERSGPSWIMSLLWQPFVSGVVDSSRSVMHVLYTIYCSIFHILLSTGFKSGELGGHSWGGINSVVSFCNNSSVAYA